MVRVARRCSVPYCRPTSAHVLADLDAEYARAIPPSRNLLARRRLYWRQAAGSIAPRSRCAAGAATRIEEIPCARSLTRWSVGKPAQDLKFADPGYLRAARSCLAAVVATLALGSARPTAMFAS